MARDYYAEAVTLADKAESVGLDDLAASLSSVIEEGFTATEILMGLRSILRNALPRLTDVPDLRDQALSLIEGINDTLAA